MADQESFTQIYPVRKVPPRPTYSQPHPDPLDVKANYDKAVEGLGKISVEFQRLEALFKVQAGRLVDPLDGTLGRIITAQLSFKAALDLFEALFWHRFHDEALQGQLKRFIGRCKAAEERRNQVIHSHWSPDTIGAKGAVRRKSTARGKLKTHQEVVSQADLQNQADELAALRIEFEKDLGPILHNDYMMAHLPKASYRPQFEK